MAEATVETQEQVADGAPTTTYVRKDVSGIGTSTQRFIWAPDGTITPYTSHVRLNSSVSWQHPIIVNPITSGRDRAECDMLVSELTSDPWTDPNSPKAYGMLSYSAIWYDQVLYTGEPDLSSVNNLYKDVISRPENIGGIQKYFLDVSFNLTATNTSYIRSETGSFYRGPRVNYFVAKATSGATTITPASIQVVR